MAELKYRIAGPNSKMASDYPEVSTLLEISGKNKSKIVYGSIQAMIRIVGFKPETRKAVHDFTEIINIFNEYDALPMSTGVSELSQKKRSIPSKENHQLSVLDHKQVSISNPELDTYIM